MAEIESSNVQNRFLTLTDEVVQASCRANADDNESRFGYVDRVSIAIQ